MATVKELKAQAKAKGIKGYSKMKKAELEKALGGSEPKPPPKPPRLKTKAQQAMNPVKQVQPPKIKKIPKKTEVIPKKKIVAKKAPAKKAPAKKAPEKKAPAKSLAAMRKELKDKGVKGTQRMKKYELELRLAPRKPALIKKFSRDAFYNLKEFSNDLALAPEDDDFFSQEKLKKHEKLLKDKDLFLFEPDGGMNASLFIDLGNKFDDPFKEKTMEIIQKLDKAFNVDIAKGSIDFIG